MFRPLADSPQPETAPRKPPLRWLLPAFLLVLYVLQCAWFIRTQSLTYDEPVHIAEGQDAWRHGRFEQYNDHPPLARLLCALPLLSQKWQIDVQQLPQFFHVPRIAPDPESLAWRARAAMVPLGLMLAILVWWAAARMFSPSAANFALALFVFSPALIAHFSLATTDGVATLFIFAAAWQLVRWRRNPTWWGAIQLGVVLGLLLLAKFSTVVMFVLVLIWMLVLAPERVILNPLRWNWGKAAAALVLFFFVVWAGYFFHVSRLTVRNGALTATFPNWSAPIEKSVQRRFNYNLLIPAGEYVEGLREVIRHNRKGQAAYFMGEASPTGGWKLYYPVTILLKWPVVVLMLSLIGLLAALLKRIRVPSDLWIMASFPAVYFVLAIFARFNLGERHVLPLYPFALLFAAALWEGARARRIAVILLSLLVVLNAVDVLRCAPGYLSYFNPFIRSENSYRLLTDSNLDWGQGLLALRQYERDHPGEQIWLAYFGSVDPAVYGINARPLPENSPVTGTVIVGATNLSGQFLNDPNGYHWLLQYQPAEILDHSLFVFKIPETGN